MPELLQACFKLTNENKVLKCQVLSGLVSQRERETQTEKVIEIFEQTINQKPHKRRRNLVKIVVLTYYHLWRVSWGSLPSKGEDPCRGNLYTVSRWNRHIALCLLCLLYFLLLSLRKNVLRLLSKQGFVLVGLSSFQEQNIC